MAMQADKLTAHRLEQEVSPMTVETRWFGNTKVTVHSPYGVFSMTPEEQQAWFIRELEAKNPIVVRIAEVAAAIDEDEEEL